MFIAPLKSKIMSLAPLNPAGLQTKLTRRDFARNLALLTLALSAGTTRGADDGGIRNTVILIIRHAEKPAEKDNVNLAPEGFERAKRYAKYFKEYTIEGKPLELGTIIAAENSDASHRPVETVTPTSQAMPDVPFKHSVGNDDFQTVADRFTKGNHNGKNALICWHHGNIPKLLAALGVKDNYFPMERKKNGKEEPAWPEDVFCWLFQLTYDKDGKLSVEAKNVMLMPGDDKFPAPMPIK